MRDNELVSAIVAALVGRFVARGIMAAVLDGYQPTQQGAESGPAVYFAKIADARVGHPERRDVWNAETEQFDHRETVQVETTFQFNATAPATAADTAAVWTAGDYLKAAAAALQSDAVLAELRAKGIGVLRVRDMRTVYHRNEQGENESDPSFDAVFTHRDTVVDAAPAVVGREINIQRV